MVKKQEVKFYICPNCKSPEVRYIFGFGNIFGLLPKMKCFNCENTGMFPLIVIDKNKLSKLTKKVKKK